MLYGRPLPPSFMSLLLYPVRICCLDRIPKLPSKGGRLIPLLAPTGKTQLSSERANFIAGESEPMYSVNIKRFPLF